MENKIFVKKKFQFKILFIYFLGRKTHDVKDTAFYSLIGNKIVKYNSFSGMKKDFFLSCLCFFLPSLAAQEARRKRVCWPTS